MNSNLTADLAGSSSRADTAPLQATMPHLVAHRSFGLDLARTIAISLVLAAHFGHKILDAVGFWGVELFFALSGFLIGQILWRNFSSVGNWKPSHILNFWQRRWWRTVPNYYLFFIVLLVSGLLSKSEIPSLLDLSKFIWFGQFLYNHNWGFYSVSWSLCIEEWFYLVFPLLLFTSSTVIRNRKTSFIISLLLIFAGSIIIRNVLAQNQGHYLRGITCARLDAIGYGVLIAFLMLISERTFRLRYLMLFVGVLFQILSVIDISTFGLAHTVNSSIFLIIVPLGFALMMPWLSSLATPNSNYKIITASIEKISLWSYSIYLSHGPIMWSVYFLLKDYRASFIGNLASKIVGLALTLVASAILYRFFEVPFTKMRPKELK
ncbi:MAG: acyltransferase [Hymenobacter sp.]|nr:MAG: acyltransferase [Hymenobacter sp.]